VPQVLEYAEPSKLSLEPTETVREVFNPIGQGKKKITDMVARLSFRDRQACFWVRVESQSSTYSEEDFRWQMFHYFARLHEKFRLPLYPIALFTFDEPFQEQDNQYGVSFPDREVLAFTANCNPLEYNAHPPDPLYSRGNCTSPTRKPL
jgi:hypothetical protein